MQTEIRNTGLEGLVDMLQKQHVRKIDMVVPATNLLSEGGEIEVTGVQPILSEDGVTEGNGLYVPTPVFDEGVSTKLGIPLTYVRRLRADRPDLMDANINGWLHGHQADVSYDETARREYNVPDPDPRSFLFRAFRGDGEDKGVARALL